MNAETPKLMKQGRFFMPVFSERRLIKMLFTEGELSSFERMMTEVPRPPRILRKSESNQLRDPTIQKRNCPDCLFYDSRRKQCKQEKCIVFDT